MDIDLTSDITSGDLDAGISQGTVAAAPPPAGTVPAQGADAVAAGQQPAKAPVKDTRASLRDQLTSAFKGEDGQPTDQQGAQSNNGQQPRAADGKFAKTGEQPGQAPTQGQEQPGQQPAAVQAPQGIDPAVFAALPVETQQQVARTMA